MTGPEPNGWNEWSRHVLSELERLDRDIRNLDDKVDKLLVAVATLKVKVALIAAGAGLLMTVLGNVVLKALAK